MIITLNENNSYNLSLTDDQQRLGTVLVSLPQEELDKVCSQIEGSAIIGIAELDVYAKAKKTSLDQTHLTHFKTRYYHDDLSTKNENAISPSSTYTFINNKFYKLPCAENEEDIVYALINKYIYERYRNEYNSEVCLNLRRAINKLLPDTIKKPDSYLKKILSAQETKEKTHYGDYLSDDSDEEDEKAFNELQANKKENKLRKSKRYRQNAKESSYQQAMNGRSEPPVNNFKNRCEIIRNTGFDYKRINNGLKMINEKLESTGELPHAFLETISTKFVVAQYRGIHYLTSQWDTIARRKHRALDEVKQAQYSSAVFSKCHVQSYHDYIDKLIAEKEFSTQLASVANSINTSLLRMQHSYPVSHDGFAYPSLFHLLQYWYSSGYETFSEKLSNDLKKDEHSFFKPFLEDNQRPLLSTADIPYHALKYAYGIKLYEKYKDYRLGPCWRKNGQAERPYSGKIYVSLHPLNDYTELNPSHVTSMFKQGLLKLTGFISGERETSFLGMLPEDRVVFQHIAKYPSFLGKYKTMFEYKYGISEKMYSALKIGFQTFPPNTQEHIKLETVLGEYLCAYQEVRLIDKAQRKAEKNGQVLIYRDNDGKFSIWLPDTPHQRTKGVGDVAMKKRELYQLLAPNKSKVITQLTENDIKEKLDVHCEEAQRNIEWARFFTSKHPPKTGETVKPVRTFTQ